MYYHAAGVLLAVLAVVASSWYLSRTAKPKPPLTSDNPKHHWATEVQRRPESCPLSARWLAHAWPVAEGIPYHLRGSVHASGLKPLQPLSWLEIDPNVGRLRRELLLKQRLLDPTGPYFNTVFAAEPGTDSAQREVLMMVLSELITLSRLRPAEAPAHLRDISSEYTFLYDCEVQTLTPTQAATRVLSVQVESTGASYRIREWVGQGRGIALACLLVQEDFILLKRTAVEPDEFHYVFVAGASCFGFSEVGLRGERGFMRLGQPIQWIHSNVLMLV